MNPTADIFNYAHTKNVLIMLIFQTSTVPNVWDRSLILVNRKWEYDTVKCLNICKPSSFTYDNYKIACKLFISSWTNDGAYCWFKEDSAIDGCKHIVTLVSIVSWQDSMSCRST